MTSRASSAPAVFWCPGSGRLRLFDKPDRAADLALRQCGKWRTHVPHSFVLSQAAPAAVQTPTGRSRRGR